VKDAYLKAPWSLQYQPTSQTIPLHIRHTNELDTLLSVLRRIAKQFSVVWLYSANKDQQATGRKIEKVDNQDAVQLTVDNQDTMQLKMN
jgi:hypothetical protein